MNNANLLTNRLFKHYLLILLFFLAACNLGTKNRSDYAVFSGLITNNTSENIRIENPDTTFFASIDKQGRFNMKIPLIKASYFLYTANEMATIFLAPGDSVFLEVNAESWRSFDSSLRFSGKGANANNYIVSKYLLIDSIYYSIEGQLQSLEPILFKQKIQSIKKGLIEYLKSYQQNSPELNRKFIKFDKEDTRYFIYNCFLMYSRPSENFYFFIENLNLNIKDHLQLESYRSLIKNILNYKSTRLNSGSKKEYVSLNEKLKILKKMLGDSIILDYMSAEIKANNGSLSPGSIAPSFSLPSINGETLSLEKLKGNYVYIDFWATYCGPCLEEVPSFEKLKSKYSDKNIIFISVSLDRQEKRWKDMVKAKKMTGIQLKPISDWSSEFVRDYKVNKYGIPHYVLIGPDQRIILPEAPIPSLMGKYFVEIFEY